MRSLEVPERRQENNRSTKHHQKKGNAFGTPAVSGGEKNAKKPEEKP